jgi:hypothetical protein
LFSAQLHIRPWEIGQLTVPDFLRLCDWLDRSNTPDKEG